MFILILWIRRLTIIFYFGLHKALFKVFITIVSRIGKMVFTTHGEPEAAAMAEYIRDRFGWNVHVPGYCETFELE